MKPILLSAQLGSAPMTAHRLFSSSLSRRTRTPSVSTNAQRRTSTSTEVKPSRLKQLNTSQKVKQPPHVVIPSVGVYPMDIDDKTLSKLPIEASLAGVKLLKKPGKAETAVKRIMQAAQGSVLGFDMELIPRFRKGEKMQPPPVLQVCYLQVIMLLLRSGLFLVFTSNS
jgi:hypothetical protein